MGSVGVHWAVAPWCHVAARVDSYREGKLVATVAAPVLPVLAWVLPRTSVAPGTGAAAAVAAPAVALVDGEGTQRGRSALSLEVNHCPALELRSTVAAAVYELEHRAIVAVDRTSTRTSGGGGDVVSRLARLTGRVRALAGLVPVTLLAVSADRRWEASLVGRAWGRRRR